MMRRFAWAVRREVWESRWLYLAPSLIAAVALLGFAVYVVRLPERMVLFANLDAAHQHTAVTEPYDVAAGLMMATGILVAFIYAVDALYGERRDRSILFWKSMPVSDVETVLAKFCIAVIVVPVIVWALTVIVHVVMLLTSMAVLARSGEGSALLRSQLHLLPTSLGLLFHIVVFHGIGAAPIFAWVLLVSAWAPRAPVAWALLVPLAIGVLERVAFGTMRFGAAVGARFGGSGVAPAPGSSMIDAMSPHEMAGVVAAPGFLVGLVIATLFLVATVRVRRGAQPA